jgi:hypothetical protein
MTKMATAISKFKSAGLKIKAANILAETEESRYDHTDAQYANAMFWSLRYNSCTQFGMQKTLVPITRSVDFNYQGVVLDEFGNFPVDYLDESSNPVVKLDPDLAYQLSVRMEEAGKSFEVPALDWSPLERAEHSIPLMPRRSGHPTEVSSAPILLAEGELGADDWVHYSFDVDDTWAFVELLCEARGGTMTLIHGRCEFILLASLTTAPPCTRSRCACLSLHSIRTP